MWCVTVSNGGSHPDPKEPLQVAGKESDQAESKCQRQETQVFTLCMHLASVGLWMLSSMAQDQCSLIQCLLECLEVGR